MKRIVLLVLFAVGCGAAPEVGKSEQALCGQSGCGGDDYAPAWIVNQPYSVRASYNAHGHNFLNVSNQTANPQRYGTNLVHSNIAKCTGHLGINIDTSNDTWGTIASGSSLCPTDTVYEPGVNGNICNVSNISITTWGQSFPRGLDTLSCPNGTSRSNIRVTAQGSATYGGPGCSTPGQYITSFQWDEQGLCSGCTSGNNYCNGYLCAYNDPVCGIEYGTWNGPGQFCQVTPTCYFE